MPVDDFKWLRPKRAKAVQATSSTEVSMEHIQQGTACELTQAQIDAHSLALLCAANAPLCGLGRLGLVGLLGA